MQSHPSTAQKPSFVSLVAGIITDVRDLLVQELALAKLEMREEVSLTKAAMTLFAFGLGITMIGLALLCIMSAHVVYEYTTLSLWESYGVLGGACILFGGIILSFAARKSKKINKEIERLPEGSFHTFKEGTQ
ncbi:MAG: phage holin family protein [Candidatus Binatia bacterium]